MSRFSIECSPIAKHNVFKTKSMRITVLTPCLLRLETGAFTDQPTQTVWNRDFPKIPCSWGQTNNIFTVKTEEVTFSIDVVLRKMKSITLSGGEPITDFTKGNLMGTARTLDNINGPVKLEHGIMSRSGVAVMDDSQSLLLKKDGTIASRSACNDLYFFAYGHDYLRALRDFYRLTGPVPLIPKFALGNWWSRYRAYTQEEYQSLMNRFIKKKIPITVATIDMDWHWTDVLKRFGKDAAPGKARTPQELFYNANMPGWTGYSWNTELFPDHVALLQWLHEQGFHVPMNVHPSQGIRYFEDCYEAVCKSLGKDPRKKTPVAFDITDPAFLESYMDDVHHPLEEEGVDFWWLDWQQGTVTNIPGLDPLWALNHYHTLDNARGENRPLILSRYAGLGSHRYPLGFSGDSIITWKSLDFQPYFTSTAANAGYTWWSHDIGGHMRGVQDDELYLRWLQYGVFSPINRLHSSNSDYMGKEPWKHSWAVNQISEEFLRLRHKLIPYLYSANHATHKEGIPVCMPLYYVYNCEEAYDAKNEYIFGSQLLVCPITSAADPQLMLAPAKVWLPEGRWTDIFTNRIYRGGQWVTMYRDLDSIPVLAGEGSIVPMYSNATTNDLSLEQPLDIHIWRGNGSFTLYEDDGETVAYRNGYYATIDMTVEEDKETLTFAIQAPKGDSSILPKQRKINLYFRDIDKATVKVNGSDMDCACTDHLIVSLNYSNETIAVRLTNVEITKNESKDVLRTDLMTRVQGGNDWKSGVFPSWKNRLNIGIIPKSIQNAMAEFEALI